MLRGDRRRAAERRVRPPVIRGLHGDVDWADFAVFADYLLGPFVDPQLAGWQFFDVDMDDDVDLRDLARWQNAFTGP